MRSVEYQNDTPGSQRFQCVSQFDEDIRVRGGPRLRILGDGVLIDNGDITDKYLRLIDLPKDGFGNIGRSRYADSIPVDHRFDLERIIVSEYFCCIFESFLNKVAVAIAGKIGLP